MAQTIRNTFNPLPANRPLRKRVQTVNSARGRYFSVRYFQNRTGICCRCKRGLRRSVIASASK